MEGGRGGQVVEAAEGRAAEGGRREGALGRRGSRKERRRDDRLRCKSLPSPQRNRKMGKTESQKAREGQRGERDR